MASKNKKSLILSHIMPHFSFLIIIMMIMLSCQSVPKIPNFDINNNYYPLESGGTVYIYADAKKARSIIELLPFEELNSRETKQLLDKTNYIVAAMYPQESGRRFQLVSWGHYPNSLAKMAFSSNKNWKKIKLEAGGNYWHSPTDRLSIALNSRQAFVVSSINSAPVQPIAQAPGTEIPADFSEFSSGAPLSCWLNNPGPMLNEVLSSAGAPFQLPVQQLYINLTPVKSDTEENQYEALIRFQFETASQARGMASLLYFSSFLPNRANPASILVSKLFANVPYQNGRNLDVKTAYLSDSDISLLLEMISLQ